MTFQMGDVVKLKSGGAQMTVIEVGLNHDGVRCTWQNSTDKGWEPQEKVYPASALEKVVPRAPAVGVMGGSRRGP